MRQSKQLMQALIGLPDKTLNKHRGVRVKTRSSKNIQSMDANTPSPQQVATCLAELCLELAMMAKGTSPILVAHLRALAQAGPEGAADQVI